MEQSIGRVACAAPAHAAARGLTARPVRPGPPHEFALSLLPVRSGRELAIGLAQQWKTWSGARRAVVALGFLQLGRQFVARACPDCLPQVAQSAFDRQKADAGFRRFARENGGLVPDDEQPVAAIGFPATGDGTGGVLLYAPERLDLSDEGCEQFALLSGRMLEQAAILEERLPAMQALERAKTEALAEFAAGAGHEINNPLATIAGRVQMLLRDEADADRRQDLATIGGQALRVGDMIGDLMLFARPPAPAPQRLLFNDHAQAVIDRFADTALSHSCRLTLAAAGPVFATADPTQARIVLSELVRNSLEAFQALGETAREIVVRLERSTRGPTPAAVVSVTDNGPGLSGKDRARLFDPFYSGREAGRGLGFGLCKCWRIVNGHGGWIEVDSVPHVATTFRVVWPDEPAGPPHDSCDASAISP